MHNQTKKLIATVLCIAMLFTLVSIPAFAAEDTADIPLVGIVDVGIDAETATEPAAPELPAEPVEEPEQEDGDSEAAPIESEAIEGENLTAEISANAVIPLATTVSYPIEKDRTFSFENIGIIAYDVSGLTNSIDYVIYFADGSIKEYVSDSRPNTLSVPAGGKLKATSLSGTINAVLADDYFIVEEEETPVMNRIKILVGETYTFKNISNVSYQLRSISDTTGYGFDYVLYDTDGNIIEYQSSAGISKKEIPAGYSIKVTPCEFTATAVLLYDKFTYTKDETPALLRVLLKANETYTFTNISPIESAAGGGRCNYILYYANGGVKATVSNSNINDVKIPAGGKITATALSDKTSIYAPYEMFSASEGTTSNTYYTLDTDKDYVFTNVGTTDKSIELNGSGSWDYILYDANNAYVSSVYHTTGKITIAKGGKAYVSPHALTYNSVIIDDDINVTVYNGKINNDTIAEANQVYKIKNTATRNLNIGVDGLSFDYVICNAADTVTSYMSRATNSSYEVPAGGYILISSPSTAQYDSWSEYFIVEKYDGELFNKVLIQDNQTYKFTNNAVVDYKLYLDGTYDYVIYKADNTVDTEAISSSNSSITVSPNSTLVVTPCLGWINAHALNAAFSVSERSYPVFKRAYVGIESETVFTNISGENKTIYAISSELLDYATYDALSNPQEAKERASTNRITVPGNGSAKLLAKLNGIDFAGLYECFTDEDLSVKVTGVTLSESTLSLAIGKQAILRATVLPEDATNKNVTWSSSNDSIATVAQTGKVTAKAAGVANITVTTADGGMTATCVVTVTDPSIPNVSVTGVTLNKSTLALDVNQTETLIAIVAPANATNQTVTWSSSDTNVATVTNGIVAAKAAGTTTITVTTLDGYKTAACQVTVTEPSADVAVQGVMLNKTAVTLTNGSSTTLTATVTPLEATNKAVLWNSDNTAVAEVRDGVVTAKAVGTENITVTTVDGNKTATCTVTVIAANDGQPKVTIGSVKTTKGKTVEVTLAIENNTGFSSLGVEVGYNSNVMTLTQVAANSAVGASFTTAQSYTTKPYNFGWDSASNVNFNGTLATLTFTIKDNAPDGTYPITLDYYKGRNGDYTDGEDVNYDENLSPIGFVYISGNVTVASYTPGDLTGDNRTNQQDATYMLRYLAKWDLPDLVTDALDMDGSGIVNNKDATILLRYLAGWDVTLK